MPSESDRTYGQSTAWRPERPRLRLFPLVVSWLATGVALDGGRRDPARRQHRRLLGRAARRGDRRGAERGHPARARRAAVAAHARASASCSCCSRTPASSCSTDDLTDGVLTVDSFGWALLAALVVAAVSVVLAVVARLGRHVVDPDRAADRAPAGHHRQHRRPRDRLPRDRRARAARAAPGDARRQRPDHGPLAGRRHAPPDRVGDRSLLADGCQPGGDPAGIERGHPGVPLGGEGDRDADDVLGAAGLRGDRAAARDRHRPARRRRRQPRQPALRRGGGRDPHRQPDGGGEEVQPRLPGVPRQRRQRDAHARPVHLGGHPRVDGGRCARSAATCGRAATAAASTR